MRIRNGRPLRFLGLVGTSWVLFRVSMAWQPDIPPPDILDEVPLLTMEPQATGLPLGLPPRVRPVHPAKPSVGVMSMSPVFSRAAAPTDGTAVLVGSKTKTPPTAFSPLPITAPSEITLPNSPLPATLPASAPRKRLSVSSWLIARSGVGGGSSAFAPQLGGTQGGVRVDYTLTDRIAATGRLAAPAAGAGRELSLGVAWRPAGVPLRFVAEQRIALDGGRGGPSVGVSGGVDAVPLAAEFRLEGYGQAGIIVRDGIEHFVDGSVRATRRLSTPAGIGVDAGVGAWGGTQRGATRLDIGPTIGARIPVFGQKLRVALDWRQRVAGDARPGSGPALTMGMDF